MKVPNTAGECPPGSHKLLKILGPRVRYFPLSCWLRLLVRFSENHPQKTTIKTVMVGFWLPRRTYGKRLLVKTTLTFVKGHVEIKLLLTWMFLSAWLAIMVPVGAV